MPALNKYDQLNLLALRRIEAVVREVYPFPEDAICEQIDARLSLGVILQTARSAIRKVEKELRR